MSVQVVLGGEVRREGFIFYAHALEVAIFGSFGIVCEAGEVTPMTTDSRRPEIGTAIFEDEDTRDDAVSVLRELGYNYFTRFRDVNGPGLSYACQRGGTANLADMRRNANRYRRSYR
jgi:hypothetical protein